VTSCSSRNEGKGPPEPEGDRRRAPNPVFFLPSSKEAPEAQTHPELENKIKKDFLNIRKKLPFPSI
jgi:hypothetical protein